MRDLATTQTGREKPYLVHCRKSDRPDALEQVLLDLNELAEGLKSLSVHERAVSVHGHLLAYTRPTSRGPATSPCTSKTLHTGDLLPSASARSGRRRGPLTTRRSFTRKWPFPFTGS